MAPKQQAMKKLKAEFGIGLSVIVVFIAAFIALSFILSDFEWAFIFNILAGFLVLSFFVVLFILPSEKKRIDRIYCPVCGEKYDYNNDVAWEVGEISVNSDMRAYSYNSKKEVASKNATVSFSCVCHKCGNHTNFSQKMKVASLDNQGNLKNFNLDTECRKYFK